MHLQTLEDVVRPYLTYPSAIQHALLMVETHPTIRALTRATQRVLKALVTRASKANGLEPVRARVDRLAAEAEVNPKTVQRALHMLAQLGWVEKVTSGRSEYGVFCARHYRFSESLCQILELPIPERRQSQTTSEPALTSPCNVVSAECKPSYEEGNTPIVSSSIAGSTSSTRCHAVGQLSNHATPGHATTIEEMPHSAEHASPAEAFLCQETRMSDGVYIDLSFKRQQRQIRKSIPTHDRITLPPALKPLLELGLKDTGICKLMGLATACGHRLEDVYLVARKRLAEIGARGARAFRYLQAMLGRSSPYAERARQVERMESLQSTNEQRLTREERYQWKQYRGKDGIVVKIFDGAAEVRKADGSFTTFAGQQMASVYDAIERGLLVEVIQ